MIKKGLFSLMLLVLLSQACLMAQYSIPQNRVWAMGYNLGLDFNTNPPTVITTKLANPNEACASVSDSSGKLLFYTEGMNVWTANGTIMPGGTNINGTSINTYSTTQGALIVPDPGDPFRYYLFSLTAVSKCRLYCNVIDMRFDNGNGDIDTTFSLRNTLIDSNLTEKMIAVPDCNNRVWILVRSEVSGEFKAYPITPSGFDRTPVVSQSGNFLPDYYTQGVLKASPDGERLMMCNFKTGSPARGLEIFDFDRSTGRVSNAQILDSAVYYGGTFSPDGSKVYAQTTGGSEVFQFDLSAADPSASKLRLGPSGQYTDMKLGPDGKIYFGALVGSPGFSNYRYMGRINYPDSVGTACQFQDSVTILHFPNAAQTAGVLRQGLPNDVVVPVQNVNEFKVALDTLICAVGTIELSAPLGYTGYTWDDNSTEPVRTVRERGTYWVSYKLDGCRTYVDSFIIKGSDLFTTITIDEFQLSTTGGPFESYQWYLNGAIIEGATSDVYNVSENGDYTVVVTDDYGCSFTSDVYRVTNYPTRIEGIAVLKEQIGVYPNPVQSRIAVKAPVLLSLSLFNIEGKSLFRNEKSNVIDISTLAKGMYLLRIEDQEGNFIKTEKVVKQ